MRYYAIKVYGAPGAFPNTPDGFTWTSHVNGVRDPGAQQIEFHIEEANFSLPSENSVLTVHGVSFQQIKQQSDLNGLTIAVYGGMMPGLPIANYQAAHRGLLVTGKINRAWGNWVGTEMSIGMQIAVAGAAQANQLLEVGVAEAVEVEVAGTVVVEMAQAVKAFRCNAPDNLLSQCVISAVVGDH